METSASLIINKEKLNRYPGSVPFTREYKEVFFGRDGEVEELCQYLNVNKLTVLYGKSGLGKSSLLNAGIIPKIEERNNFLSLLIRFGSFQEEFPTTPKALFSAKLNEAAENAIFLPDIDEELAQVSLWRRLKALEWKVSSISGMNDGSKVKKGILLVFDQFEELFSYPNGIEEFAKEFADLISNQMPEGFQRILYEQVKNNPAFRMQNKAQLTFIDNPPSTRVLIAIRADRMSLLDRLSPFIPNILNNNYELKPLSREAAKKAIIDPAKNPGDYKSLPFTYAPDVLKEIMSFLTENEKKPVEPFQLQILCQHTEKIVEAKGLQVVSKSDLGVIEDIYKYHYDLIVGSLAPEDQVSARNLVEEGLIFQDGQMQRRLSIYEGQIRKNFGVSEELLRKLVDSHLLRSEPDSSGGFSYEICHDSMLAPILKARTARLAEKKIEEERQKRIEAEQKAKAAEARRLEQELQLEESARQLAASEALKRQAEEQKIIAEEQKQIAQQSERRAAQNRLLAVRLAIFVALIALGASMLSVFAFKQLSLVKEEQRKISALEKEAKEISEEKEAVELVSRGKILEKTGFFSAALEFYNRANDIVRIHELNDDDLKPMKIDLDIHIKNCEVHTQK